jgi:hypothetical protein
MRSRILLSWLSILVLTLIACSLGSIGSTPPSGPIGPAVPTFTPSVPPLAPTDKPTSSVPVNTPAPLIGVATTTPVTGTDIITVTPTLEGGTPGPTSEATLESLPTQTPKPPVSSGPLEFSVDVAGCRVDSTRDGGIFLTLRFNPTGGNGVYTFYDEGHIVTQVFDRPATKGSSVIDAFRVDSSDGQSVTHKIQFKPNDYCR